MNIEWKKCGERMPPDRHDKNCIAKVSLGGQFDADIYMVSGAVMCRYYDEFMLDRHSWTEFTQEKWEFLNK